MSIASCKLTISFYVLCTFVCSCFLSCLSNDKWHQLLLKPNASKGSIKPSSGYRLYFISWSTSEMAEILLGTGAVVRQWSGSCCQLKNCLGCLDTYNTLQGLNILSIDNCLWTSRGTSRKHKQIICWIILHYWIIKLCQLLWRPCKKWSSRRL